MDIEQLEAYKAIIKGQSEVIESLTEVIKAQSVVIKGVKI